MLRPSMGDTKLFVFECHGHNPNHVTFCANATNKGQIAMVPMIQITNQSPPTTNVDTIVYAAEAIIPITTNPSANFHPAS